MIGLLRKLTANETARDMSLSGIDLGTTRARILIKNVANCTSLRHLSMNRAGLEDDVGEDICHLLIYNKYLRKMELESNKLGPMTAK